MKQQVELFDCAIFLDEFQELVPVDKKSVSFSFQIFAPTQRASPCASSLQRKTLAFLVKGETLQLCKYLLINS